MSANWWEIGKPVQEIDTVSAKGSIAESDTEDKAKQNWWEIGRPVEEPAQTEAAPVRLAPTTPGQGAGMSFQDLFGAPVTPELAASYKAVSEPPLQAVYNELERQAIEEGKTSNVLVGGVSRAQDILGNLLEGTSRIPSVIPETAYTTSPILGGIKAGVTAVAPGLQGAAERFKKESEKVNYSYGTQLKDLADNPLNVVPFVLERFAVSIPDMAAALYAAPAYIVSLTNETLNERLKNDGRNFEDATVADVAAAGASAVLQSKLEKFATSRFGRAETVLGETAIQGGTEAIQEIGQYVAQTAGTKAGFDPTTAGLIGLEAGIAGGGIGLTFAGAQDFAQRRIEARVRGNEELGSQIENNILDELRNQAFEKAKSISAPELNKIPIGAGQTEATPVQYGDAYAQKIYDTIGNYIPVNAEFKVEEKTIDGAPKFIVTDKTGTQYGQDLDSRDRADSLSLSLNNTTRGRAEAIKQLEPLQSSLSDALKGFGLNDVGLSINNRVFTRRGEALTSEGLFDPVVRRVFLAVDAVDPQGNLDTNQRREALRGVLRHEVVHALRYLDLWKRSEWKNLEGAASNLKKPGTDKTYLQIAQENYADQNKVIQVEESVADLIRDVAGNISRVAGKPRNLSERAINFFDKTKNALTGAGFQTYEDVIRRFEQGVVGARERGRIRTFRATEERLAEQGRLPDRVQRLFATPQDRNQFRQETVQKVQQETPAVAVPAINSLRLNALRESRSTIDPVPPKITVDEQEVPTRDSEGRLIYSGFEGPDVFNTPTRPTMDGLRNFWNWFGSSKAVDKSKRPLVYYHGTAADITAFQPKQAGSVFLTRSPRFAKEFSALSENYMVENFPDFMSDEQVIDVLNETLQRSSAFTPNLYDIVAKARDKAVAEVSAGKAIRPYLLEIFKKVAAGGRSSRYLDAIQKRLPSGANLMPVYVRAEKPWDYDNKDDIKAVVKRARDNGADITASMVEEIGQGNWQTIEGSDGNAPILDAIRELGYDSMFVEEGGQKNLAVFNPGQIKSAIGNNGDFSPLTPSIRESRVRNPQIDTPEFQRFFADSKVVDANNQPLVVYHGTDRDIDTFKVGREGGALGNGIYFSPSAEFAGEYARREGGNVVPAYVSLKNPLVIDGSLSPDPMIEALMRLGVSENRASSIVEKAYDDKGYITTEVKSRAEKAGFDGILQSKNGQLGEIVAFRPNQIKSAVGNIGAFDTTRPSIRESRVAKPRQILFEVAPDPNNQSLTEAWRGLDPSVRLTISERVAKNIVPMVLDASGARGTVVGQVGSYLDDTNPSFALMLESGDPLDIAKSIGFALSQDSMMVVAPNKFNGGDVVQSVTVNLGQKSPQEVESIYNSLREIEVDGSKPVGGQTFANGFMTILNYSDVQTDTLADLIDKKLNGGYNVLVTDVYSAFPEKKDYDYASPENDGSGKRANLRKRLRDIRAEATDSVQRELQGISPQGRAAGSAEAALISAVRESRRSPNVVGLMSGEEVPPRKLKGKTQVAQYLQDRALEALGGRTRDLNNEADRDAIADDLVEEAIYEMEAQKNALEWYDTTIERTIELLSLKYPEIKTDQNARTAFLTGLAITSQNIAVPDNLKYAEEVYNYFKRNRRFPEKGFGSKAGSIKRNFEKANMLIDSLGSMQAFTDFLQTEFTVGQLNPILKEHLGKGAKVGGELVGAKVYGSAVFGPKIGNGFYTNLRGDFSPVTIDMWFMRTIGRLRGNVMDFEEAKFGKQLNRLAKSENMEGASTDELVARATQLAKQHEKDFKQFRSEYDSGVRKKSEATNAAITIVKSLKATRDAPSTGREREQLRDIVNRAINKMRDRTGQDIPPAAFQALIWYPEQDLYKKLGVNLKHVRQDYANSTKQFLRNEGFSERELKRSEDRVRSRRQRRTERVRPGAVAPVEAAVAPTGRRIGEAVPGAEAAPLIRESRRPQAQLDQAVANAEAARPPAAREARRRGTPIGPTQPGPTNDTDSTSAAEALNGGQPVDSIGTPSGPTISDTEPDGTVDISGARIAPLTRRLVVQMIQSAPDKLRSGIGLDDLAKRVENYYDTYASRLGVANGIIRDAFKRIDFGGKTAALTTFEEFIRARENGRTDDAQSILDMATDSERQLIDAWNEIARQTGEINTSIRTPDGKPMRVWDAKRNEWRPIRSVRNFFPRTFRREVMEVMQNPDLDPVLWQSLLDSLVEAGIAETTQGAEKYLLREWFSDEVAQDYFAGVEKARTEPLPEIFYDYSWDAATRYLRKWSRRTAQIENFGQTIGKFQKEWFDKNIPKVRDQETQNYLNSIKERVYEIEQFNALTNMSNWANSLATATQLGNPVSASLNLLGGTITNVQEFGIKEIAKSYANLVLDWKNVQNEGTTLGILNKDFMNILNDHVEMDADKYFSKEQKISQALAKFSNFMLTIGGFNGAENIVRSSAMLAARSRLNSFLNDVRSGSENDAVKRFREWIKRENLDVDALILEDGAGKETERFMRRAVNVPQGSYSIDMTPVFIDSAAGRFLLKYQKFGTQVNRFFYNHFLKVFYDNPTPRNFMRVAGFVGSAIIGGGAIIAIREAFGYGDPGPDDEEIKKAFEKEDTARAWSLIFSRAWQNIMTAGSLGFFANYAQFAKDWQDQQRVKNPFSPPGLASVDAVIDVFNRLRDQGKLTARDLDEIAETTLSFYRANKRIGLAAMDAMGSDAREVRRFAAQKEIREVREYGRRYSEAMEIEFKQRTAPGTIARTPMTPVNKAITDALQQGDAARARLLVREAIRGLRGEERDRVEASIRASVRNRQPIQIGGSAPSQQELQAFMRWSRQNLPAEKYQMIRRADMRYRRAASRAGVGIGG